MQFENVTCVNCGLLCDDLSVKVDDLTLKLSEENHPCDHFYSDASLTSNTLPSPLIARNTASEEEALAKAAALLKQAKLPLINGLIADVQTYREAIALTEKLGGVIDHANGAAMRNSTAAMQRIGEVKTTLAEVKNRADCVIIFGANVTKKFPRLMQRILTPEKSLGSEDTLNKKIIILDVAEDGIMHSESENNISQIRLNYPLLESLIYRFQEVVTRPKEYFIEHNAVNDPEHDKDTRQLFKILDTILNSQYTTLIWSTSNFNLESAEHTVQALTESIKTLMKKVRCVGLALSGSKGEITANQVATWQTGVPLPVSFTNSTPVHNPVLYDGMKMLQNNETDCVLWLASFSSDDIPPQNNASTIVFGHPNMTCDHADVFIPIGIPGIDHRGLASRTDSVATLPLQKIRDSSLPSIDSLLKKLITLI
ncbi:MAG: hypothetical protein AAF304_03395 [Pseudomonadota bacterium]